MRQEGDSLEAKAEEVGVQHQLVDEGAQQQLQAVGHWMNHSGSNQIFSGKHLRWRPRAVWWSNFLDMLCLLMRLRDEWLFVVCTVAVILPKKVYVQQINKQQKKIFTSKRVETLDWQNSVMSLFNEVSFSKESGFPARSILHRSKLLILHLRVIPFHLTGVTATMRQFACRHCFLKPPIHLCFILTAHLQHKGQPNCIYISFVSTV